MVINELDTLAEVAESLRDAGWAVVASGRRLVASKGEASFSMYRERDDEFRLAYIEIASGGKDHEFNYASQFLRGSNGSAVEIATFATTMISVFKPVMDHLVARGFEVASYPGLQVDAHLHVEPTNKGIYLNMRVDNSGWDGLPLLRISPGRRGPGSFSELHDIVDPGQAIAEIDSHLTRHNQT